jgi:hypothetical protein
MKFIETLKSIGGVKSCLHGCPTPEMAEEIDTDYDYNIYGCPKCHGTGQILDLAPLLAKPEELTLLVRLQIQEWLHGSMLYDIPHVCDCPWDWLDEEQVQEGLRKMWPNLHIVGPQRAGNLVYEVARQLGGTAVVAVPITEFVQSKNVDLRPPDHPEWAPSHPYMPKPGYRLSLPIPTDATVLFVTDRIADFEEYMTPILRAVMPFKREGPVPYALAVLPYVLTLVSSTPSPYMSKWDAAEPRIEWKIISLHKEKT